MKKAAAILITLLLCGCNKDKVLEATVTAVDGTSCSVAPEYSNNEVPELIGARISCTDGSFAIILNGEQGIQGEPGVPGQNGLDGQDAKACQAYRVPFVGAFLKCPGQWPVLIADGRDGRDGESCSVRQLSNGARITCGNSVAFVYNGTNGRDGQSCSVSNTTAGVRITCGTSSEELLDGRDSALANAIGIAGYIRPCGNEFPNDEIFLRMTDNQILALYDGGPHEDRLVLLAPGNYITTDRNKNKTCHFTVTSDLRIINEQVK